MPDRWISATGSPQVAGFRGNGEANPAACAADLPTDTAHIKRTNDMDTTMQAPTAQTQARARATEHLLEEIRETNLSYLMLAQNLIRADREEAMFRLGLSESTIDILARLSPAQIMRMASGSTLLCQFRMSDDIVWNLLTHHGKGTAAANDGTSRLHASILLAGRHQQAA
jgi:flagellar transcriptional activator FlhD